jgi:hypothetical protein
MCSATMKAIQTLTSGKQIIEVEVGKIQCSPWLEMNQGQFERTSALRNLCRLVDFMLDCIDDNLFQGSCRAAAVALARRKRSLGMSMVVLITVPR